MPWEDVVPELTRLHRFIDLAVRGLQFGTEATRTVEQRRRIAEVLRHPDPFGTEETYQAALSKAAELEDFAKEQAAAKFSYVHELAVVKLWSILETAIDQLAFQRLREGAGRENQILTSIEGPLLPFLEADAEEQADFLLSKLKVAVKASLQRGIGRFEAVLNPLGLGGPVDTLAAKAIVELSEVRHVIVHRRGVADRQFVTRCPWVRTGVGERLEVSRRALTWYSTAADWYVVEVDARLEATRAGGRPTRHLELLAELAVTLKQLAPSAAA